MAFELAVLSQELFETPIKIRGSHWSLEKRFGDCQGMQMVIKLLLGG